MMQWYGPDVLVGEKCSDVQISIEDLGGASNQDVSNHWTLVVLHILDTLQVFIVLDAWSN